MMDGFTGHGWGMGWGWIIGLIIIVAIIWFFAKSANQNSSNIQSGSKSPFDILKERYAKGEIDKPEFEQRKNDLE